MIWLFNCDNLDLEFGLSNNLANYLLIQLCFKGFKNYQVVSERVPPLLLIFWSLSWSLTFVVMEHEHSLVIPPHFDGNNYAYWKVRMKTFLKSIDERV